ncbi:MULTISPECIES: peroxiredoxin family protein [Burkholderia]|nr:MULTISPECIES: peroxiredoxin family protein [Burkholderia]EKS9800592.1 redoxin domain-containing protein [Burkholderia cepacia]EKS9807815.1 redoxin domain-containing protein [Burkholderia cepacia]EKS9815415.1 redoxin domain-containing protein [Burkholderia cepacia]EKS9821940.1 redoxin domain-containing protein [Burkholderia cepacia]EKS9829565.1 redoxin domain-containing protein [Burkholderia cepacia]
MKQIQPFSDGQAASRRVLVLSAGLAVLVALVAAIFWIHAQQEAGRGGAFGQLAGKYRFQVGDPGPGQLAPPIRLMSTDGNVFDLSGMRGKSVLLYFQEGVTCQPCWDQAKDLATHSDQLRALGVDSVVTIASDPVDVMRRVAKDMSLSYPVLSDPDLAVSSAYHANDYGMMGRSRDGHSFVLVGPDGRIRWRADYGGAPDYTMYLPVPNLIADMRQGMRIPG